MCCKRCGFALKARKIGQFRIFCLTRYFQNCYKAQRYSKVRSPEYSGISSFFR
ncbi:hypothetical protein NEILACOT_04894 [Neisseria lactamica ATCC 23970]|uniref:Uncharacterized protein n=1 Tax=Neisseria lactamica ATCC 23970 TaxID=546265 RepID=D0WBG8_NEILA|nr:hypothetical protein NEILACOT_04894 [Neisseria lactamica ATCC 23970]